MRSIVTGGSGFIGTHLCRRLLASGHRVLNLDALTYAAVKDSPPDIRDHPDYAFLHADITDAAVVRQTLHDFQPDRIFHLAAETHVDRSITDAAPFLHTNVLGTHTLLEAVLAYAEDRRSKIEDRRSSTIHDLRSTIHHPLSTIHHPQSTIHNLLFLHISTDEVYGHLGPHDPPFTESSPLQPRSPYAASKAAAEHLVRAWQITHGLHAVIVRPANNFGPHQHQEKFIPTVIRQALAGEPIPIYGDGSNIRDWIHVEDHVHALTLIAENARPGETFNIGANQEISNLQLATLIVKEIEDRRSQIVDDGSKIKDFPPSPIPNPQSPISFTTDRPGHDFRYAIDTTKLRTHFPTWQPTHNLHSSLHHLITHTIAQSG